MAKSKKKTQKQFLAVFLGSEQAMKRFMKLAPAERREREAQGIRAWHEWVARNVRSIVEMGAPLGSTQRVDRKGIRKTRNEMAAYVVVQAPTHAAAARLFRDHPHFAIFPGEAVEVMECLEIPG